VAWPSGAAGMGSGRDRRIDREAALGKRKGGPSAEEPSRRDLESV